ncbi:MAG: AMP-binding protein, partial [Bacteriovoracaceae bacterium]
MNCVESYFQSSFSGSSRPAIVFFDGIKALSNSRKNISFKKLTKNSIKAQRFLKSKGFNKGDAILLFEAPSPDMYAMILAMLASGIQIILVEPWMPLKNINKIIAQVRPKGFMSGAIGKLWGARSKEIRRVPVWFSSSKLNEQSLSAADEIQIEKMGPHALAILTFTSGTSGNPKGVHRKHQFLVDQAQVLKKYLHYEQHPGMDMTIFTNVALLNLGMGKGSLLIPSKWPKRVLNQIDLLPKEYAPDTLAAGPAFLIKLMNNAKAESLRSFHMGGALADCWIYEKAFKRWPTGNFTHVYGSSEAEPVALADLRSAVALSKKRNYFQTLYLGRPIKDIEIDQEKDTLWVAGPHVSPLYEGDDQANRQNKRLDSQGRAWHNMGDRINIDTEGFWYRGRSFQEEEDFDLEQELYQRLGHSKCFIKRED